MQRATIVKRLAKLLADAAGKSGDFENTVIRYAVNEVQPVEERLQPPPTRPLLKLLAARGIVEIPVAIGQTFDESFSPGKFDRRKVAVSAPRNSIVKVLQRGFVDARGNCIQKAVLAVASPD